MCNGIAILVWEENGRLKGLCNGEQPPQKVWDVAFSVAKPFFMKHGKKQLQYANLIGANLRDANLRGAIKRGV